eukprot:UN15801
MVQLSINSEQRNTIEKKSHEKARVCAAQMQIFYNPPHSEIQKIARREDTVAKGPSVNYVVYPKLCLFFSSGGEAA